MPHIYPSTSFSIDDGQIKKWAPNILSSFDRETPVGACLCPRWGKNPSWLCSLRSRPSSFRNECTPGLFWAHAASCRPVPWSRATVSKSLRVPAVREYRATLSRSKQVGSKRPFRRGGKSGRARRTVWSQLRLRRCAAGRRRSAGAFKPPCQCRHARRCRPVGGCVEGCILLAVHKRERRARKLERSCAVVVEGALRRPWRRGLGGAGPRAALARRTCHARPPGALRGARWGTLHRRPRGRRPQRCGPSRGGAAVACALQDGPGDVGAAEALLAHGGAARLRQGRRDLESLQGLRVHVQLGERPAATPVGRLLGTAPEHI